MINISNHPSTRWGERQLKAAQGWCCGTVVDIPFPAVPASATTEEVVVLARGIVEQVGEVSPYCSTVHIMGESGLLFGLLFLFLETGRYTCLHSTTERKVVEKMKEDGAVEKTAVFEFIQFRAYW